MPFGQGTMKSELTQQFSIFVFKGIALAVVVSEVGSAVGEGERGGPMSVVGEAVGTTSGEAVGVEVIGKFAPSPKFFSSHSRCFGIRD